MGVISGRVTDEVGEPIAGVSVWAFQSRYFQGRRQLVPNSGAAQTDDTGQYRLLALPPGDYVIRASIRETWIMEGEEKQTLAFAPTFFPGMTAAAEAQRVRVAVGQEVTAIDFALTPGRAAKVSGTVDDVAGSSRSRARASTSVRRTSGRTSRACRAMEARRRPPMAASRSRICRPATTSSRYACPRRRIGPGEFAMVPITVTGADLEGIVLTTGRSRRHLRHRERRRAAAPLPAGPIRLRVGARAVNLQTTPRFGSPPAPRQRPCQRRRHVRVQGRVRPGAATLTGWQAAGT